MSMLRERIDSSGNVWYWTSKDDDQSEFFAPHPSFPAYATTLAMQCKDFNALFFERVQ